MEYKLCKRQKQNHSIVKTKVSGVCGNNIHFSSHFNSRPETGNFIIWKIKLQNYFHQIIRV